MENVKRYAKAAVAVAAFVVVAGNMVLSGDYDSGTLLDSAVAALAALGVYRVANKR